MADFSHRVFLRDQKNEMSRFSLCTSIPCWFLSFALEENHWQRNISILNKEKEYRRKNDLVFLIEIITTVWP